LFTTEKEVKIYIRFSITKAMVLTEGQVPTYLISKGLFKQGEAIDVAPLGGGLVNHLFLASSLTIYI